MRRTLLIGGIVVGAILCSGPLWGLLGTIVGMRQTFSRLDESPLSPEAIGPGVNLAVWSTRIGLVALALGLPTFVLCLVALLRAPKRQAGPKAG